MDSGPLQKPTLFGSSNTGKVAEVTAFARSLGFAVFGLDHESLQCRGQAPRVPEVSDSYEGNARLKGSAYARWANMPCITDDTGLELGMLGGLPGVYTAPWGAQRVADALGGLREVAARFVCYMVYTEPSGRSVSVRSSIEGSLRGLSGEGAKGPLPFSHFFYPEGAPISLGALVREGQFIFSHRYRALNTLVSVLS